MHVGAGREAEICWETTWARPDLNLVLGYLSPPLPAHLNRVTPPKKMWLPESQLVPIAYTLQCSETAELYTAIARTCPDIMCVNHPDLLVQVAGSCSPFYSSPYPVRYHIPSL